MGENLRPLKLTEKGEKKLKQIILFSKNIASTTCIMPPHTQKINVPSKLQLCPRKTEELFVLHDAVSSSSSSAAYLMRLTTFTFHTYFINLLSFLLPPREERKPQQDLANVFLLFLRHWREREMMWYFSGEGRGEGRLTTQEVMRKLGFVFFFLLAMSEVTC